MADKLPWFRTYIEAATDPKFDLIAAQTGIHQLTVFGAWFKLLCIAGGSPVRGSLYVTALKRYSNNDVAMLLRLGNKECEDLIQAFIEMDMMTTDQSGALVVTNWNKRQFESDNSTKRVQKHRETAKEKQNETPVKRYSNVSETPPDTDTETDTNTDTETDTETEAPSSDSFSLIQQWLSETTGLPADGQPSIEAINQIIAMGAEREDVESAYNWWRDNTGRPLKYYGQLVNSIRTAHAKRTQAIQQGVKAEGWTL